MFKYFIKLLFFYFIFSINQISIAHEFWIEPEKFHITNQEVFKANLFVGENFQGSNISFSKKYLKKAFYFSGVSKIKKAIKGRLGDIPAINIPELEDGINIIQIETGINYVNYKNLLKFELFSRKKGYPEAVFQHKENNYPTNFNESYIRYAKSLVTKNGFEGSDIDTNLEIEIIILDNPFIEMENNKRILFEYKNNPLVNHQISIISIFNDQLKIEFFRTNINGKIEYNFKRNHKYLIDSIVLIEGSNKKKDQYAKWHSLWASSTFFIPK
jgi:uncharacterized GH25 family protein